MKQLSRGLMLIFVLVLVGCTQPSPEPEPDSAATEPADPVVVDSAHYQVALENDWVRVLRISYGPREKSEMHDHPDGVAVELTDGVMQFTLPDGSTEALETKAGAVMWAPITRHLPENLGSEPFRGILVELKDGAVAEAGQAGPDPVEVDPDHYKVAFENDRVRVLHINYGPGEKSAMHYHPAAVAVFLQDQSGKFNLPDGSVQEQQWQAGDVEWMEAEQHSPESSPDGTTGLVLVELK